MYTKKKNFKIVSFVIICLSTLILTAILTTSAESKIFKISDIEISEPYNANFNKDKVINKGFSAAFKELTLSIITTKDQFKIKSTKLDEIKYLIESFEINNESFLEKKYIANFNVNFNKKRTLNFFEKKNIFPSLKKNKDFLTILIFIDNDKNQIYLYEKNPFYQNWNSINEKFFLINYILIDEDLEDIRLINDNIYKLKKKDLFKNSDEQIVFLENIRFYKEEENNDISFAKHLAGLGDLYVNDAFSCSHRAHASIDKIARFLPSFAGLQLETEINALKKLQLK